MRRPVITLTAILSLCVLAVVGWGAIGRGSTRATATDANERAVLASPVMRRLLRGTRIRRFVTDWQTGCEIGLTAILDHRIGIHASGITASTSPDGCRVGRRATWSMNATGVPSIFIALNRQTHRITYINPDWGAPGAKLTSPNHWDGAGLGFPPGGD
jgi:hypothetical protein